MRILACTLALLVGSTAVQAADVYAPAPGYGEAPPPAYGPPPPAVAYPGPPPPAPRYGYFVPQPPYGPPPVVAYGVGGGVPPYVYRDARAYPYPDFRQSWTCWWEWGERRCGLLSHW
jgi:hypothetical protein